MATDRTDHFFAWRPVPDRASPHGAWWPASRDLVDQLPALFGVWPPEAGRIVRVLYSPPDWDDHPHSVDVGAGRRVKTGSFPRDDTHQLTVSMMDGTRHAITVIPPETAPETAAALLSAFADAGPTTGRT